MKGTIRDVEQFGRVLQHQTLGNSEDKKIFWTFRRFSGWIWSTEVHSTQKGLCYIFVRACVELSKVLVFGRESDLRL